MSSGSSVARSARPSPCWSPRSCSRRGCRLLISVTSAGQILPLRPPPYFVIIDRALRDEGTSYHYLPPAEFSEADPRTGRRLPQGARRTRVPVERGRDLDHRRAVPRDRGGDRRRAAERACSRSRWRRPRSTPSPRRAASRCSASRMSPTRWRRRGDFEKGEADGTVDALAVIVAAARAWSGRFHGSGLKGKEP